MRNGTVERIRRNRGTLREHALVRARNTMVDLLFRRTVHSGMDAQIETALKRASTGRRWTCASTRT